MEKQQLDRMEDMLTKLIKVVGNMNVKIEDMNVKIESIGVESKKRHTEVLEKLRSIELDQDHIWEKTVKNEREISRILKNNS